MYTNGFSNPYMYQPYYQAANFTRGFNTLSNANNLGRAATGFGINNAVNSANGISGIKGLLGKFSFSGFLNGASKTLNVVNQAIPIFYQVKPIINNAKTMFRIMGAVKDDNNSTPTRNNTNINTERQIISNNLNINNKNNSNSYENTNYQNFQEENPTFFI